MRNCTFLADSQGCGVWVRTFPGFAASLRLESVLLSSTHSYKILHLRVHLKVIWYLLVSLNTKGHT